MAEKTFWGHLEVLRWVIVRSLAVVFGLAVALFCCKEFVFERIILNPCNENFITYRILEKMGMGFNAGHIEMININLASQLMTHLSVSFYLAVVLAFPYITAELWFFVKPALYRKECRPARVAVFAFFLQFFLGLSLAYFLIFPLTYNFLGNYQVSSRIENQISLSSYISTFIGLVFTMGLIFELPIVAYFFARIGVLKASFLRKGRKVAIVLVMIVAAFITPSTDVFTMCLVAMPLWLLYELSVYVTQKAEPKEEVIDVEKA
ncbi:MAG: twin-arginine translocase subunit TatC [Bacteroidales bacterium]|nr:twin-arginine translocase subunit TatC [Bacteroidales bacterium]